MIMLCAIMAVKKTPTEPAWLLMYDHLNSCRDEEKTTHKFRVALAIRGDLDGSHERDGGSSFFELLGAQQSRELGASDVAAVDGDSSILEQERVKGCVEGAG